MSDTFEGLFEASHDLVEAYLEKLHLLAHHEYPRASCSVCRAIAAATLEDNTAAAASAPQDPKYPKTPTRRRLLPSTDHPARRFGGD